MSLTEEQPAAHATVDAILAEERLARLREHLAAAPYDTLVLTTPESVNYATGYRSLPAQIFAGYALAAVVTADAVILVAPASDTASAIDSGFPADDIVPFGRFYFSGDAPAATMSDRHASRDEALGVALGRVRRGRTGVEGLTSSTLRAVVEAHASAVTDATDWVMAVRAVKLPAEQALLRTAATLAEAGITAALAAARAGATERELADTVATVMAAGGGTPRFVVVTAGARSPLSDAFPTDLACRPGDLIRFDVGCIYGGYWSDIARTAVVGEPTALQQERYDALLAGVLTEFAVARPGATAGEVFAAAQKTVQGLGLTPYLRHHVGHAIGLTVYERPVIAEGSEIVLEPGMVLCLETPYYEIGWGGMMVEDTGVVTDSGFELFTSIDRSLQVVAP
jgi:Xaa-Pro aminopeptidase